MSWHPTLAGALAAFTPIGGGTALLTLGCVAVTVLAIALLPRVLDRSPVLVGITCLWVSWIPVQLLALAFEDRRMWLPGQHSAVFFWGDSVLLPASVTALAVLRQRWRRANPGRAPIADATWWRVLAVGLAVLIAIVYRANETGTMTPEALALPAKAWHDFVVYPVFAFLLLGQLPYLWQSRWRLPGTIALGGVAVAGVLGWWLLGHWYDPAQAVDQRPLLGFA